ncbi:MAG: PTS sugar transporter subunit IIA [Clostridia bacterium]|nr:PTS sugar transporter subunit IIA [Clostridia bacterium]
MFFKKKRKEYAQNDLSINEQDIQTLEQESSDEEHGIIRKENILLNLESIEKEEAVKMAGELLVKSGYVEEGYIQAMLEREKIVSTYIGNGVAIPHGIGASKDKIKRSGIVVLQFPEGVEFGDDNKAYLILGIAGKDNEHLTILSNIALSLEDTNIVEKLVKTKDADFILSIFAANH